MGTKAAILAFPRRSPGDRDGFVLAVPWPFTQWGTGMRPSSAALLAAALVAVTLAASVRADGPADKKGTPVDAASVECVLLFRLKNEEPVALEKARREILTAIDPRRGMDVLAKLGKEYAERVAKIRSEPAPARVRETLLNAASAAYHAAITKAIEAGEVSPFALPSDALREMVFLTLLERLKRSAALAGHPVQRRILGEVERYAKEIGEDRPDGSFRFLVPPSIELLSRIEGDVKAIDGASTAEAKTGSAWRAKFDETSTAHLLVAARERKWKDEQWRLLDRILADRDAARGIARLAGFHNRLVKELREAKPEGVKEEIGGALDSWIVAPEGVKTKLMQDRTLREFVGDPKRFLATHEAELLKRHGEGSAEVRAFRAERASNEARLKAMGECPVKLFPTAVAK